MSYGPSGGQPPYGSGSGGYGPPPPPPPSGPPGGGAYGAPPPPPPGSPGGGGMEPPANKGSAIGATIANGIGMCLTCGGTTIGLVLGIIGIVMAESNPKAARTCTLISWILFGVALVFGIIAWIWYFVAWASYGATTAY
ncbi:hypothetical protein [Streptomonospora wellingtoniae]|uniref:DUF4190 domain-containing protein n=1 Tax=Streptomonospora wellingtoniae TaxID=3075544 RepID=A0ABU2KXQ2_9ACTN|nr:hypothetical protein [Streptomonospora sp. DSM 45055]MDT0303818.1 hypothetical protein [Streptomonospora sp. DSM 45055]